MDDGETDAHTPITDYRLHLACMNEHQTETWTTVRRLKPGKEIISLVVNKTFLKGRSPKTLTHKKKTLR